MLNSSLTSQLHAQSHMSSRHVTIVCTCPKFVHAETSRGSSQTNSGEASIVVDLE